MKIRLIAFSCHLVLSAIVVALVMAFVIGVWYPSPLFYAQNFSRILITLVSVDLVLGPLLTFLVYNPQKKLFKFNQKKLLKFDLAIIFLIQICALSYGIHMSYISRPVYVVYSAGKFESVGANEYDRIDLRKVFPDNPYLRLSKKGPVWVGAIAPETMTLADKLDLQFSTEYGDGLRMMPHYYVPYEKINADAIRRGKRASDLNLNIKQAIKKSDSSDNKTLPNSVDQIKAVRDWLSHLSIPLEKIVLIPLKGRDKFAIVALNADTGIVLDSISQDPWWYQ
ncbi:MAG: hypothetical protein H7252_01470 [Cytophaga sp.]|nr:hypothetical protein [Undibacterium sp.]